MDLNFKDDGSLSVSRRKLYIRKNVARNEMDMSKALILYQPPGTNKIPGRSLIASEAHAAKNLENSHCKIPQPKTFLSQKEENGCMWNHLSQNNSKFPLSKRIRVISVITVATLVSILCLTPWNHTVCIEVEDKLNIVELKSKLESVLFGQPIAIKEITGVFESLSYTAEQITVLLLFGPTGTGKTYSMTILANSLPDSIQTIKIHAPLLDLHELTVKLEAVKHCHWNVLIVEDSDFASIPQLKLIVNFLKSLKHAKGPEMKLVAVFISNYGQKELLNQVFKELQNKSYTSEFVMPYPKISNLVEKFSSPLIEELELAGFSIMPIPYFPLERKHVEACIVKDLKGKEKNLSRDTVERIMNNIYFFPPESQIFSLFGCKPVSTQVNLHS